MTTKHSEAAVQLFWRLTGRWSGYPKGKASLDKANGLLQRTIDLGARDEGIDLQEVRYDTLEEKIGYLTCAMSQEALNDTLARVVHLSWRQNEYFEEPEGSKGSCRDCKYGLDDRVFFQESFFSKTSPTGAECPKCGGWKINVFRRR